MDGGYGFNPTATMKNVRVILHDLPGLIRPGLLHTPHLIRRDACATVRKANIKRKSVWRCRSHVPNSNRCSATGSSFRLSPSVETLMNTPRHRPVLPH